MVVMVLKIVDEDKVREWRWKRTEYWVRRVYYRYAGKETLDVWCASIKAENITDLYPVWARINRTLRNPDYSFDDKEARYARIMMPLARATEGHSDLLLGHMRDHLLPHPDPPWFVNGPRGPANLYYPPSLCHNLLPQPTPPPTP